MTENMNRQLILKERPTEAVELRHFDVQEQAIPEIADGQILLRIIYLSIEPLLRGRLMSQTSYASSVAIGQRMTGRSLSVVCKSRNSSFKEGDIYESWTGWTEYAVSNGVGLRKVPNTHRPLPIALGLLGSSGLAAYLSLTELGGVSPGNTVLVTSAAGATGSIVVQLAKLAGARVVGIAGGRSKCDYVKQELSADHVIDYKACTDLGKAIESSCPDGVDIYWDCVSGEMSQTVFDRMNTFGRVIIFGTLDLYGNPTKEVKPHWDPRPFLVKRLQLSGFLQSDYTEKHELTRSKLSQMFNRGLLKVKHTEYQGLESAPSALCDLLAGEHNAKVVVKLFDFPE